MHVFPGEGAVVHSAYFFRENTGDLVLVVRDDSVGIPNDWSQWVLTDGTRLESTLCSRNVGIR
jgi:hypothetical protein